MGAFADYFRFGGTGAMTVLDRDQVLDPAVSRKKVVSFTSPVALTATRKVIVDDSIPDGADFVLENATTGGQMLMIVGSSGSGITLTSGQRRSVVKRNGALVDAQAGIATALAAVQTMAALVAGTYTTASAAVQAGYSAIADGGGGLWAYDNADTTTPDNGGTVRTNAGNKLKRVYSNNTVDVRWFGAKPTSDGSIDSTSAFAAAAAAIATLGGGATLLVPPTPNGQYYKITVATAITVNNVTLDYRGEVRQVTDGQAVVTATSVDRLTLKGLFKGAGASTNQANVSNCFGVDLITCTNTSFEKTNFENFKLNAVRLSGCVDTTFTKIRGKACGAGILIRGCTTVHFIAPTLQDCAAPATTVALGIVLDSTDGHSYGICEDVDITDAKVRGYTNGQAILLHAGRGVTIKGGRLNNVLTGVSCNPYNSTDFIEDVTVSGVSISLTSTAGALAGTVNCGILAQAGPGTPNLVGVTIIGNTVRNANAVVLGANQGGISCGYIDGLTLHGNNIFACYASGIVLNSQLTGLSMIGNVVRGTLTAAGNRIACHVIGDGSIFGVAAGNVFKGTADAADIGWRFDNSAVATGFYVLETAISAMSFNYVSPSNAMVNTTPAEMSISGVLTLQNALAQFSETVAAPYLTQATKTTSGAGQTLTVQGQTASNGNGGAAVIAGGRSASGGVDGNVFIFQGNTQHTSFSALGLGLSTPGIIWNTSVSAPTIKWTDNSGAGATLPPIAMYAASATGTGTTTGSGWEFRCGSGTNAGYFSVGSAAGTSRFKITEDGKIGVFNTTPIAQPTLAGALTTVTTVAQLLVFVQALYAKLGDKSGGFGWFHDTTT